MSDDIIAEKSIFDYDINARGLVDASRIVINTDLEIYENDVDFIRGDKKMMENIGRDEFLRDGYNIHQRGEDEELARNVSNTISDLIIDKIKNLNNENIIYDLDDTKNEQIKDKKVVGISPVLNMVFSTEENENYIDNNIREMYMPCYDILIVVKNEISIEISNDKIVYMNDPAGIDNIVMFEGAVRVNIDKNDVDIYKLVDVDYLLNKEDKTKEEWDILKRAIEEKDNIEDYLKEAL